MRSIAQLTAGARRAQGQAPRPPNGRAPGGARSSRHAAPGEGASDRPVMPADGSREALVRLVETVAPRLGQGGLTDKELRGLRAVVTACRWEDFVRPDRDPVCFRQQQRLAAEIGVTSGHFRKIEAKLERAGLIERATCENGHRGRLGPGPDGPVAGLSLAPLLAALPRLEALAGAMAAERAALAEGRAMIRIERRAARHAVEGLGEDHPARRAYEALRGAGFRPSARFEAAEAIAAHLEALRAVIEAARAAADEATHGAGGEEPIVAPVEGQDDTDRSGAARPEERRHTEDTTDPQTGSCRGAEKRDEPQPRRTATGEPRGGVGREDDGEPRQGEQRLRRTTEDSQHPDTGEEGNTAHATRLPPAVLRCLTPRALRDLSSEEMRLYVDHLDPQPGPPTLRDVERAALMRRRELAITPQTWEEVEASLGWLDALVALIVVDANRTHPTAPVRNPAGLLRDLARRRRAGTLDLGASVMGLWRRQEPPGGLRSDGAADAPCGTT